MTVPPAPDDPGSPPALPWLVRYRHLIALGSFIAGVASYALVQRRESFAQALVILLPLGWLLALAEPSLLRHFAGRQWLRHSPLLLRYAQQALHQESFFFTLPFFLATTTWNSPQALFTLLLVLLALASIIDPIYIERIATRPALLGALHAFAAFTTVLTAAPMLWQITTATSLSLALAAAAGFGIPALATALPGPAQRRWPLALLLIGAPILVAYLLRPAIPTATLRTFDARVTTALDTATRTPGAHLATIDAEQLQGNGLYAWTPIHAPRGLAEQIEHQWWHDGKLVDRIPITIRGGREQGYRAWTHKTVFGADPRGEWSIRVVTQSDQLIGIVRIRVR